MKRPRFMVLFMFLILSILLSSQMISAQGWTLSLIAAKGSLVSSEQSDIILVNKVSYVGTRILTAFFDMSLEWISASKKIVIKSNDLILEATVGITEAYINNQKIELINAPENISGKTYISAADCARLGLEAIIDDINLTVKIMPTKAKLTDIKWTNESGHDVVEFFFSKNVNYTSFYLSQPDRLVIDVDESRMPDKQITVSEQSSHIVKEVRYALFKDGVIRLVVSLNLSAGSVVKCENGVIKVVFYTQIIALNVASENGVAAATIESSEYINIPAAIKSQNLYIYDISGCTLVASSKDVAIPQNTKGIVYFKAVQFDSSTVRITLKLEEGYEPRFESGDSSRIQKFYVEEHGNSIIDSVTIDQSVIQKAVGLAVLKVTVKSASDMKVSRLPDPERIIIDIPQVTLKDLETNLSDPAAIVKGVRTSQFTKDNARVVVDLSDKMQFEYELNKDKTEMTIYINSVSLTGKVIMIDPGHGGSDPGAVNENAVEKNINLSIALKLKAMLEKAGAIVLMTRDKDVYFELLARSVVANSLMPDIFVSIHSNTVWDPTVNGVESFYYNLDVFSKELATDVLLELVKVTGQKKRNVSSTSYSVIRETCVPSTLVEVGFISNEIERNKLLDDSFQTSIALGIFNGIELYFKSEAANKWSKLKTAILEMKTILDQTKLNESLNAIKKLLTDDKVKAEALKGIIDKTTIDTLNGMK